jgi:hypothetical protein
MATKATNKIIRKKVEIKLAYTSSKGSEPESRKFVGHVIEPKDLEELTVFVDKEKRFNFDLDEMVETGRQVIYLQGSRKSYLELGRFFIGMAQFNTPDRNHYQYLNGFGQKEGFSPVELQVNIYGDKPVKLKTIKE